MTLISRLRELIENDRHTSDEINEQLEVIVEEELAQLIPIKPAKQVIEDSIIWLKDYKRLLDNGVIPVSGSVREELSNLIYKLEEILIKL